MTAAATAEPLSFCLAGCNSLQGPEIYSIDGQSRLYALDSQSDFSGTLYRSLGNQLILGELADHYLQESALAIMQNGDFLRAAGRCQRHLVAETSDIRRRFSLKRHDHIALTQARFVYRESL